MAEFALSAVALLLTLQSMLLLSVALCRVDKSSHKPIPPGLAGQPIVFRADPASSLALLSPTARRTSVGAN
jgi:hypothetical protein